ncbi:MAG TPA: DoxX family protein [Streptosporangiaceae bacterium]|nr:DoxX family protein [Streptosporangiaceae bacterium]
MLQGPSGGQGPVMTVLRAVARPMLAAIFLIEGYKSLREPERVVPAAEPVVRLLSERVPAVPANTKQAVRVNGAVQLVAGSLLAIGRLPRTSALAIAATLVPTTAAGHRFWEAEQDADRRQQQIQFLKNLAMFGGLLIAGADTEGNPSLAWRTRHAARATQRATRSTRRQAARMARTAKVSGQAGAKVGKLSR